MSARRSIGDPINPIQRIDEYADDSWPAAGQWTGLVVKGSAASIRLDYCDIRYAAQGVKVVSAAPNQSQIKHSRISRCANNGLWVKNTKGITITGNVIERNDDVGVYVWKTEAVIDTNVIRLNGATPTGSGHQLKLVGRDGDFIRIARNFFGGDRTQGMQFCEAETCFVRKGISIDELSGAVGDTLLITENTFKYIDETALELNLPDAIPPDQPRTQVTVGDGDSTDIGGNEFANVNCVYDLYSARNTTVSWTAAAGFDVGIRTNDTQPVFGRVLSESPFVVQGGYNFFIENPDTAFITITDPLGSARLYAEYCNWNMTPCTSLDPKMFLVEGQQTDVWEPTSPISVTPCNVWDFFVFPWSWWPSLKQSAQPPPAAAPAREASLSVRSPSSLAEPIRIMLYLPADGVVAADASLEIFDVTGRRIRNVPPPDVRGVPTFVDWDGRDDGGAIVASGVYIVRLQAGGSFKAQKALVLR